MITWKVGRTTTVPEPGTGVLLLVGLAGLAVMGLGRGKRTLLTALAVAFCLLASPHGAEAGPMISVGPRIDISPTTFALPILITDAAELAAWSVGLTYNATDVQINTACDPFVSDSFCSLLTGPFTEGDFFAAGAPFNLLVPGIVELDPISLLQTGSMFGFHGAFGGSPPGPSGDGTLAFVEFLVIGDGTSPITVTDPVITSSAVPEPATLALFASGLALLAGRRVVRLSKRGGKAMKLRMLCTLGFIAMGLLALTGSPPAQAAAAPGPYYAWPSWDQTLPAATRFIVLTNMNSDAVLDRETGLVWEKSPSTAADPWIVAQHDCIIKILGGRRGWRLPTVQELVSLVDPSIPFPGLALPAGHPFINVQPSRYWSATTFSNNPLVAWNVAFNGLDPSNTLKANDAFIWCVRGGQGVDPQ